MAAAMQSTPMKEQAVFCKRRLSGTLQAGWRGRRQPELRESMTAVL
jgi:hypothetical protein